MNIACPDFPVFAWFSFFGKKVEKLTKKKSFLEFLMFFLEIFKIQFEDSIFYESVDWKTHYIQI